MLLALALAAMAATVVATVALPLIKAVKPAPERGQFDRAVYRDQLRELERNEAHGMIDPAEAALARLEIERRLLAADGRGEAAPARSAGSAALAMTLALLIPLASALLYVGLGAPRVPDQPYAARGDERARAADAPHGDIERAVARREARLKANPESEAGWLLLARSAAALGQWPKSAAAYGEAMRLSHGRPDIAAGYGEMLVMAADGIVTPQARDVLRGVLERDPGNAAARYYLALGEAQAGNAVAAIAGWQLLAAEQPAQSPLRAELRHRIEETARAAGLAPPAPAAAAEPSKAQMAAAAEMTPEARREKIRGMVDGLAAKLQAEPEDLQGWLRLARAYGVLGERQRAADAYEQAARLKPEDTEILLAEARALLPEAKPEAAVPEQAVSLLRRVEAIDPKQPAALWYLGLAAAQQRNFAEAARYWQRLLAVLPQGTDQHQAVAAALDAIREK